MKFVADSMLGKLARWLRLSGYDVLYRSDIEDDEILKEDRIILTRDSKLFRRALKENKEALLISSGRLEDQLKQMIVEKGIVVKDTPEYSRCPKCNGDIVGAEKDKIRGSVPDKVLESVEEFWVCRNCGKVYWYGSHWKSIRKIVKHIRDQR
jgi:hypothetical protein